MAKPKKKTLRRGFDFEVELYNKLMDDAEKNARTFPSHIMWILKQYIEKTQ